MIEIRSKIGAISIIHDLTIKWLIGIAIVTIIFIYRVLAILLGIVYLVFLIYCWYKDIRKVHSLE